MRTRLFVVVISLVAALVVLGAANKDTRKAPTAEAPTTVEVKQALPQLAPATVPEVKATAPEATATMPEVTATLPEVSAPAAAAPAAYQMNWYSINGGGAINASSTNYQMGLSVGQSVAGAASGTNYDMGIGFWYGASSGSGSCPIVVSGDLNLSGTVTSADIIVLVNYVFKGGPDPLPCAANGDGNCNGAVTSSDIIVLVNYVFKGGPAPCDACTSPLAASC